MLSLGRVYLNGFVLSQNIKEEEAWLQKAANFGNLEALTQLGHEYLTGNILSQNTEKGEK
jgi:TPR repeat protein